MSSRGRKAWLNPRKKKVVKGYIRKTKKGTTFVEPHLHEYPYKAEEPKKGKKKKEKPEEPAKPKKEKLEKEIEGAKKEVACRLGVGG